MDSVNGNSGSGSTKAQQLKPSRGSVSPMELAAQNFVIGGQYPQQNHHSNFHILDPYASPNSQSGSPNLNSPFVNLLHWSSGRSSSGSGTGGWGSGSGSSGGGAGGHLSQMPLNSIENLEMPFSRSPTVLKTPVKIEEDVLVMDGIDVNSEKNRKSKGSAGAGQRTRSPLSSGSTGGRLSFSSSSSSGKENHCVYKMVKCRSWDEFGTCRFGSKCQFAHVMEELHAKNYLGNNKSECSPLEKICKPVGSGLCTDGNMPRLDLPEAKASTLIGRSPAENVESVEVGPVSPIEPESTTNKVNEINTWCPLDDGISLPSASSDLSSSRAAVNAHVDSVLYGFSGRKRLSAFLEFCPK